MYTYIHIYIYISQDSQGFPRLRYGLLGFARISQGLTRPNKVAQGLTRSHMVSQGLTRSHKVPQGPKRSHKASQDLTRSHKVSQGLTRSHKGSHVVHIFDQGFSGSLSPKRKRKLSIDTGASALNEENLIEFQHRARVIHINSGSMLAPRC